MVLMKELRCVLPITAEQYRRGHIYTANHYRQSNNQQTQVKTVQTLLFNHKNDEKNNNNGSNNIDEQRINLFSHRQYQLCSFLPVWAEKIIRTNQLAIESKQWDLSNDDSSDQTLKYTSSTFYSVPLLPNKVAFSVETKVHQYNNCSPSSDNCSAAYLVNPFNLSANELSQQTVENINPCNDAQCGISSSNYKSSEDPKLVRSDSLLPLSLNYAAEILNSKRNSPYVVIYSLIRVRVSVLKLLDSKAEQFILDEMTEIYAKLLRLNVCWIEQWKNLSLKQILQAEEGINGRNSQLSSIVSQSNVPVQPAHISPQPGSSSLFGHSNNKASPSPFGSLRSKLRSKL
jgi:hypothetical protein